jgi:hypothetical protein
MYVTDNFVLLNILSSYIYIYIYIYPQKLALTSPTSGGHSVGIVRLPAQVMKFVCLFYIEIESSWSQKLSILHVVQLGSVIHPVSYPIGTKDFFNKG